MAAMSGVARLYTHAMKVGISTDDGRRWLREPITRGLLASALLHFAFVTLFQSSPPDGSRQVVVINARLQQAAPANQTVLAVPVEPQPVAETVVATEPLLTALTPSVAPPVPAVAAVPPPPAATPAPPTPVNDPPGAVQSAVAAVTPSSESQAVNTARQGSQAASNLPSLPLGIDTNWYLARQVDKHPKAIGSVRPVYPEAAQRDDIEGTLKLKLRIDDLGRVQDAEVVEATPPGIFDEAALSAFRKARFQPAMKDGRPVRYEAYIRVEFELKD